MNTKAVILDLDGTLLHSDGSVSQRTLSALDMCRESGIIIVVATARFWFKAEKYLEIIMPDYAILADGTQIYHNGSLQCGFPMDKRQSAGIIGHLLSGGKGGAFVACTGKNLLCSEPGIDEKWRNTYDFTEDINDAVYKIAAVMDSNEEASLIAKMNSCRLYSYRGENLYGFTGSNAGKLTAVCALMENLGIGMRDVIAFGDDENDLELIRYCGKGVAVANAIAPAREIADEMTESNDDDGVARYLERFFLR